jgi:hypothetical protein
MIAELLAPAATASAECHADWLELRALLAGDLNSSLSDLARAIRSAGTIEAVIEQQMRDEGSSPDASWDWGEDFEEEISPAEFMERRDDLSEAVTDRASDELDDRALACGDAYPFTRGPQHLQARRYAVRSVYVFLLLLSTDGVRAGPPGLAATELFEDLAAVAAQSFFGRHEDVHVYHFGFPRRRTLRGFKPALDELCVRLGEGGSARSRPDQRHQKDAKLDLVTWRSFPDGRMGQLVAFGQCAAGADWTEKLSELQPRAFTGKWLTEPLGVEPTRMFFCPFRIEREGWETKVIDGGLLFDRCRIAHHCAEVDDELLDGCERFSAHVLEQRRAHA